MTTARKFVAVLRASSAVRLTPNAMIQFGINHPSGVIQVTVKTRYEDRENVGLIPREIWLELSGHADSLAEARAMLHDRASAVAAMISLTKNAAIDELQLELVFDVTEGRSSHEFFESFMLDETGLPRASRQIAAEELLGVLNALSSASRPDRLARAAAQYEIALRHSYPGHEALAMAHLWMASEALTKIVLEQEIARAGSRDALLEKWGIEPRQLDATVRERVIFQGDHDAYSEAKEASDGFEHGFLEVSRVRALSIKHASAVSKYVRASILRTAGLDQVLFDKLIAPEVGEPLACQRQEKYVYAELIGEVSQLHGGPFGYPMFRLESSILSIEHHKDGSFDITPHESFAPGLPDGVVAQNVRFELWGASTGATSPR